MRITTVLQIGSALCGLAVVSPATAKSDKFQTIYSFAGGPNDGAFPMAPLISDKSLLYGTTDGGGPHQTGTVYAIDLVTGKETIVSSDLGGGPATPVTLYKHNLFGTTVDGANTIFSIDIKTKQLTNLYNFPFGGGDEPAVPSRLTEFGGKFFGTTFAGGKRGCGNVFSLDPATDKFKILHTFKCGHSGKEPLDLTLYRGMLYGGTVEGGPEDAGTIFSVDPVSGTETTIYPQGVWAEGVAFHNGVMYGSSTYSGSSRNGTLFSFDLATRQFTVLYSFPGGASGCGPVGAPIRYNHKLYGVASSCGDSENDGLVFEISLTTGKEKVLHRFTNGPDGGAPDAGLLLYEGALYGTTIYGGTYNSGTVFRYTP
jgi:uncharacterized repeat protein (TIGR03803 family)